MIWHFELAKYVILGKVGFGLAKYFVLDKIGFGLAKNILYESKLVFGWQRVFLYDTISQGQLDLAGWPLAVWRGGGGEGRGRTALLKI